MVESAENQSEHDTEAWHRSSAADAFNHTWTLLDADELSREQEEEMLASTFAQRYHWYIVGEPRNWAIADWQVARVAAMIGYFDLARRFAERSLAVSNDHDLGPFVTGFAHEAMARAAAQVDDVDTFTEQLALARAQLEAIEDAEEREALAADLAEMSEV